MKDHSPACGGRAFFVREGAGSSREETGGVFPISVSNLFPRSCRHDSPASRMIHELELHRKSRAPIEAYVTAVARLVRHYGRSPEAISVEEIRDFLHHLITVQKAAFSTCNLKLAGIQFFTTTSWARNSSRCVSGETLRPFTGATQP